MLSQLHRLKKTKEIEGVFKNGRWYQEDFITLKLLKNPLRLSRFVIIVSTKTDKRATVRNRIKRCITEIIRKKLPEIVGGYDVLLIPKKEIINKNYQEIEDALDNLFKKAGLL